MWAWLYVKLLFLQLFISLVYGKYFKVIVYRITSHNPVMGKKGHKQLQKWIGIAPFNKYIWHFKLKNHNV